VRAHPMRHRRSRRAGHTLIEMMVVLATLTIVLGGVTQLLKGARDTWQLTGAKSRLQESGRRMLETILSDLRHSGLTTVGATNYPSIWERPRGPETTPLGPLVASMDYGDASLVSEVMAWQGNGDRIARNAARVSDEIAFQMPQDLDGDGTPLDPDGNLEWGPELISYRVVDDPEGRPWLQRYRELNGAIVETRIVGPSVTSVTFDVVLNDRSLRFGIVDVVLYLSELDANGQTVTAAIEGSVNLRNTRQL